MGSWTFTADSDLQTDLSTKLNTAADNYDAKVALMYAEIAGMGANWVGEDYDLFKSGTEGYKQALTDLGNSIRMFGKQFEKLSSGTDTLASSCVSIIQSLSSAGGGGFAGSTGTGSAGAGTGDGTTGDGAATTSTVGTENGITGDTTTGDGTNGDTSTTTDGTNGTDTGTGTGDGSASGLGDDTNTSVTLNSGDVVKVNGQNMRFYGAYSDANGRPVNMYADAYGNLFYEDGSAVQLSRVAANGQTVKIDANLNNIGTSVRDSSHGYSWDSHWRMTDADGNIIDENGLASTVVYEDANGAPQITDNDNMGALVSGNNSITQSAVQDGSYVSTDSGTVTDTSGNVTDTTGTSTDTTGVGTDTTGIVTDTGANNGIQDPVNANGTGEDTYTSVTLNSGDVVNVNGQNMRFYGAYNDTRGRSVNMYADAQGNLFFEDGSAVQLSRVAANGQTVKIDANLNNVGTSVRDSSHGYSWDSPWVMNDADGNKLGNNKLASSVVYEDSSAAPQITDNDNMGALVSGNNSITQSAVLKDSYVSADSGSIVNGHTIGVPSSMQGLRSYIDNGVDVIRIDPQYDVQWDPSASWNNGFDFDTSDGPVYLMKSSDGTYYNICDEYGNIINDKKFTPDGFNTDHGSWK